MMKNNFYPITIIKKDNLFIASIAELGISVSGKNHADTFEECIAQKNKILKQLEEKGISFPDVIHDNNFNFFSIKAAKKSSHFILKSIASTIIFVITLLILVVMFSPIVKNYVNSPNSQKHFNIISNKLGISICMKKECPKLNE